MRVQWRNGAPLVWKLALRIAHCGETAGHIKIVLGVVVGLHISRIWSHCGGQETRGQWLNGASRNALLGNLRM